MGDLAEVVRGEAPQYVRTRFTTADQRRALRDIVACRTEAMGTVVQKCDRCGAEYELFRSCGNRSCPSCQSEARQKWLETRRQEILPVPYLQVVFSTPAELNVVAQNCPREFYSALIRAAGQAVIDVGWSELGARLGAQVHLHTWSQSMAFHLHAHCVVPCGGFSEDRSRWITFEPGDLPRQALSRRFRELLCKSIQVAARHGKLDRLSETVSIETLLAMVKRRPWKVYAKPPYGGVEKLLAYLARSIHRGAIANDRIESYENHQVRFRCRGDRPNEQRRCTLGGQEFLRRLLMHVLPRGFVRIRRFGFLGNRNRKQNIERARQLMGEAEPPCPQEPFKPLRLCPACAGRPGTVRFARPYVAPQFNLSLRPPPTQTVAA